MKPGNIFIVHHHRPSKWWAGDRGFSIVFSSLCILTKIKEFQLSEENLTELGFEREPSGSDIPVLLPAELSSPVLAVPQIVNYLCSGWGASQKP